MTRDTRIVMGMPVTIEVVGGDAAMIDPAFRYFEDVDRRFSTYRADSEISAMNRRELAADEISDAMREVLTIAERTRQETFGYFNILRPEGGLDPSGIVKGWAIRNAVDLLRTLGAHDFYVDAGGDIQSCGRNASGLDWSVGIRSPFDEREIIKVVYPRGAGVATSGDYARGDHIYDPHLPGRSFDVVGLTVIGSDILEADRFATAAFAMGEGGILFLEAMPGLEGYIVRRDGRATMTSGFEDFCAP